MSGFTICLRLTGIPRLRDPPALRNRKLLQAADMETGPLRLLVVNESRPTSLFEVRKQLLLHLFVADFPDYAVREVMVDVDEGEDGYG